MNTPILIICIFALSFGLASADCYWTEWLPYIKSNTCKSGFYSVKFEHIYKYAMLVPGKREYCCPNE
ncbi:hypothetical protein QR680_011700 [Steinernema hermaphroditum]|uniref:EMI domain-containing protein n=1 Tax=Steinernema hermaphroditum TaxID=289476 RepID=A0AA39I233_9BILA|nr:hypothetical protein QR680_011700 [Steinernema hermaphroditum]